LNFFTVSNLSKLRADYFLLKQVLWILSMYFYKKISSWILYKFVLFSIICAGFSRVSQMTMIISLRVYCEWGFKKQRRRESGFPRLSSLVNAGEYARLWKILWLFFSLCWASSFLILRRCLTHSTKRFRTSLHRTSHVPREKRLIPDSRRTPCGTTDTEVVIIDECRRIGRRTCSNARSNQRRMDHLLLSARSQPPSPSRQITISPPAHHSGTKSHRSLLFW